jgi:DNA-binding PadR family transcriptional regulator
VHKELLLLGMLLRGPKSGYDIHRIVLTHGELYADLKKANVYYLLDRLAREGALDVRAEEGARGPRRERLVYAINAQGRERFFALLRSVLRSYEPIHIGIEVATFYFPYLAPHEIVALLEDRRQVVQARKDLLHEELDATDDLLARLANDHLALLMDAELIWIDRALAEVQSPSWEASLARRRAHERSSHDG